MAEELGPVPHEVMYLDSIGQLYGQISLTLARARLCSRRTPTTPARTSTAVRASAPS